MVETSMDVTGGKDGGQQKGIEVSNVAGGALTGYRSYPGAPSPCQQACGLM